MRCYSQLTQEQRYQIHAFMKAGSTQKAIAEEMGVFHHSKEEQKIDRKSEDPDFSIVTEHSGSPHSLNPLCIQSPFENTGLPAFAPRTQL